MDAVLRDLYDRKHRVPNRAFSIKRLAAKKLDLPAHACAHRAQQLGLCRVKEPAWTQAELAILHKHAGKHEYVIQKHLKAGGFRRTITAICMKRKRECGGARANRDGYTASQLAECMGVDRKAVSRWIALRFLVAAAKRKTDRSAEQGGDPYVIKDVAVRDFVANHPCEFDLRRVDQLWFIDLIRSCIHTKSHDEQDWAA